MEAIEFYKILCKVTNSGLVPKISMTTMICAYLKIKMTDY